MRMRVVTVPQPVSKSATHLFPCLLQAMRALLAFDEGPAIFAGDTNLREAEVKQEKLVRQVRLLGITHCLTALCVISRVNHGISPCARVRSCRCRCPPSCSRGRGCGVCFALLFLVNFYVVNTSFVQEYPLRVWRLV